MKQCRFPRIGLWIFTIFLDMSETMAPNLVARADIVARPRDLFAKPKEDSREGLKQKVLKPRQLQWNDAALDRPLSLPLEPGTNVEVTGKLARAQLEDDWSRELILKFRAESDGTKGVARTLTRRQLSYVDRLRLAPDSEMLEFHFITKITSMWIAYLPQTQCPYMEAGHSWRFWAFRMVHETIGGGAHRAMGPTISMVQRMGWWPTLSICVEAWWLACESCSRNRGKPLKALAKQMSTDDEKPEYDSAMPWGNVVVDVEGPFSPAGENGARYVLTYKCKVIKASLMATMTRLTRPRFVRAFLECLYKSRRVPKRVFSDRGPEVHNALTKELMALLGVDKRVGLPYQPTYQGGVERDHLESKLTLTCILEDLARTYPTEWEFYVPAVEYLKFLTPYGGGSDLCPRDLDHGWSLAADVTRDLIPFQISPCETESEFAANLFANYLEIKASFDRYARNVSRLRAEDLNVSRSDRGFKVGDIVYRKPVSFNERRGHTLMARGQGPFVVARVVSPQTVVLERLDGTPAFSDPVPVGELIDRTPRRPTIALPEEAGTRSLSDAQEGGEGGGVGVGQRKGWGNLAVGQFVAYIPGNSEDRKYLAIGKVLQNTRQDRNILVQCMRATWTHVTLKWKLVYFLPVEQGDRETLEATGNPKTEPVKYSALIRVVDLLVEGELGHSCTRALDRSGYRLKIEADQVHCFCQLWREDAVPTGPVSYLAGKLERVVQASRGRRVSFSKWTLQKLQVDTALPDLVTITIGGSNDRCSIVVGEESSLSAGTRSWTLSYAKDRQQFLKLIWMLRPLWLDSVVHSAKGAGNPIFFEKGRFQPLWRRFACRLPARLVL